MQGPPSESGVRRLLSAAVIDELQGLKEPQMLVGSGNDGTFDPVVDRRRVPSLKHPLVLFGYVLGVLNRKAGFDLEGLECAGLGRYCFLSDDVRCAGFPPDSSISTIGVGRLKAPALADLERRPDSGTALVRRIPPLLGAH